MSLTQIDEKPQTTITHAGGVVYRDVNGRKEYLLVTSRRFSFIWVLPKGHIKPFEAEEHAALREVKEESSMKASVIRKMGYAQRRQWNFKKQVVAFYLMKFVSIQFKNKENRKTLWLPLEAAIKKLFYSDQRRILKMLSD